MVVVTIVVVVRGAVVVVCSAFVVVVVDPALEFEPLETNTPTIASTAIAKTAAPATIHFRFDDESELFGSRGVPADPGEAVFGGGGGGGRVAPKGGDSGFASELLGGVFVGHALSFCCIRQGALRLQRETKYRERVFY